MQFWCRNGSATRIAPNRRGSPMARVGLPKSPQIEFQSHELGGGFDDCVCGKYGYTLKQKKHIYIYMSVCMKQRVFETQPQTVCFIMNRFGSSPRSKHVKSASNSDKGKIRSIQNLSHPSTVARCVIEAAKVRFLVNDMGCTRSSNICFNLSWPAPCIQYC